MQRILYVGMQADYGDVARGVSFEERNFHHTLRHFPGLIVEHFDFMAECRRVGRAAMSAALLAKVAEFKPHLLFLVGFDDDHDPERETIREITETTETATLLWVCDDHWRFEGYSSRWVPAPTPAEGDHATALRHAEDALELEPAPRWRQLVQALEVSWT